MNSGMQLREEIFGSERTEQEALQMIRETPGMYANYMRPSERLKQEVLDFCMGKCGLNLTYDPMFKAIFNPQQFPSRLEDFLSLCLLFQRPGDAPVFPGACQMQGEESALFLPADQEGLYYRPVPEKPQGIPQVSGEVSPPCQAAVRYGA